MASVATSFRPALTRCSPAISSARARPAAPRGNSMRRTGALTVQAHAAERPGASKRISDRFETLAEVTAALRRVGVESANLIVGIDCTKSNEWTGEKSFGKSLHHVSKGRKNPYESAISIVGKTLESLDDDKLIPFYGFGDVTTTDKAVFSFFEGDKPARGFQEGLERYRQLIPTVALSGPTSFGPIIRQATRIVRKSEGAFHILLIIADGQVSRPEGLPSGQLSPQEADTVSAIVDASLSALSICVIGVGDGPFDLMEEFDDCLKGSERLFDNFQFVRMPSADALAAGGAAAEADFALNALMEIPEQYAAIGKLGLLGAKTPSSGGFFGSKGDKAPLPPPAGGRR